MRRMQVAATLTIAGAFVSACGVLGIVGSREITIRVENRTDAEARIEVIHGGFVEADAPRWGDAHVARPHSANAVTFRVPGGEWVIAVDGKGLVTAQDTYGMSGELPITIVIPPDGQLHWTKPQNWPPGRRDL